MTTSIKGPADNSRAFVLMGSRGKAAGRVLGDWPGLSNLYEGRDLLARRVFAAVPAPALAVIRA